MTAILRTNDATYLPHRRQTGQEGLQMKGLQERADCDKVLQAGRINSRGCRARKGADEESPGFTGQDAG